MDVKQQTVVAVGADVPEVVLTSSAVEKTEALLQEGTHDVRAGVLEEDADVELLDPVDPEDEASEQDTDQALDDMSKGLGIGNASWLASLECNKEGRHRQSLMNIEIIFTNDLNLIGLVGLNEFSGKIELLKEPEWRKKLPKKSLSQTESAIQPGKSGLLWCAPIPDAEFHESDFRELRSYMSKNYGIEKASEIREGVRLMAERNRFHSVKQYLENIEWDGKPRLETLFIDCFGAMDSKYVRTVTKKTFVAAVARIYEPGCQFDYIPTFYGRQGLGKTIFWNLIAGRFYRDMQSDIKNKDTLLAIQGKWIIEIAELAALATTSCERIKAFVTKKDDDFRKPYDRENESHPRQSIFVATTNQHDFLKDNTGNRRWLLIDVSPVQAPSVDMREYLGQFADQIWAEAKAIYDTHEEKLFLDAEMSLEAEKMQRLFMNYDPVPYAIIEFLERKITQDWYKHDRKWHIDWMKNQDNDGDVERKVVSYEEIIDVALDGIVSGKSNDKLRKKITAVVCNIRTPDGRTWHRTDKQMRFGVYGKQRYFELY